MAEIDLSKRRAESEPMDEEEITIEAEVRAMLGPEESAKVPPLVMLRFVRGYFYENPRAPKTLAVLQV